MGKKLKAKVNGVEVKDGELVTLVVQAKVSITDRQGFDGDNYRDVEFVSLGKGEQFFDAYQDGVEGKNKKFDLVDVTVIPQGKP